MNWRRHFILGLVVAGGFSSASLRAGSAPDQNPYAPIITRNVFALVPIPVHDPADDVPVVPPPKITPNGIMTLFGKLQVLFKVGARPGQPPKDESYVMGVGERQDDVEVQAIDEKSAIITFNNHGIVQKLSLVASAASGGDAAPVATTFGSPGIPRPNAPVAIGFGGRFGRNRTLPGASNPAPSNLGAGGAPSFGGGTTTPTASGASITPEAAVIMLEAQRAQWKQEGNPGLPILPPTQITSQVNRDGSDGGDSAPAPEPPMPGE